MKKLLVIGVKGMAGHIVFSHFEGLENFDVYGIARNIKESDKIFNLDISDTDKLKEIIDGNQFDYIINCIGILNKDAEDNPAKAIWFNSYFPHFLEETTRNTSCKIIHISTDCVFSGKKGGYTENDMKDGVGFYAQSKALGELDNSKDLTIRTSIIGPELNENGIGLFHWFIRQSDKATIQGYSKAYWSGITTLELATVVENAIWQDISGLIEISPENKIDKFSLLSLFNKIYKNSSINIIEKSDYFVDKSLISIREDFIYKVPSYEEMLLHQKEWIETKKELYPYYKIF